MACVGFVESNLQSNLEEFTQKVESLKNKQVTEYDVVALTNLYDKILYSVIRKEDWDA